MDNLRNSALSLDGAWKLSWAGKTQMLNVPSVIENHTDSKAFFGPYLCEREFDWVPEAGATQRLEFDGVSYFCEVRLNGQLLGTHEGVWDAFAFDATAALRPGRNTLSLTVQKPSFEKSERYFYRSVLFGFIPDISMPFGGIWKSVRLRTVRANAVLSVVVRNGGRFTLEVTLAAPLQAGQTLTVTATREGKRHERSFTALKQGKSPVELPGEPVLWSPSNPALYDLQARLHVGDAELDTLSAVVGFRSVRIDGKEIRVAGDEFRFRGVLHWGSYEDRISPTPSREEVETELSALKAMGFNAVKHCLYFPPDYYYELCDRLGMLVWQEMPLWQPFENGHLQDRIDTQYPKMLELFMHHPSVCIVSLGCELDSTITPQVLNSLYGMVKAVDPGMPICANSGNGSGEFYGGAASQSDVYAYHFYPDLQDMQGLIDEFSRGYRETKPWVFGEFNDSDTWRNVERLKRERGTPWWTSADENVNLLLKTHKGFESGQPVYEQGKRLADQGLDVHALDPLEALSWEATLLYRKHILETARRNPVTGYNITVIKDTPLVPSGLFDDRNRAKWTPEQVLRFNGEVVLTLDARSRAPWKRGGNRVKRLDEYNFLAGEEMAKAVVVSNWGPRDLAGGLVTATVTMVGQSTSLAPLRLTRGRPFDVTMAGELTFRFGAVAKATEARLDLELKDAAGKTITRNDWTVWVHPEWSFKPKLRLYDPTGRLDVEGSFDVELVDPARLGTGTVVTTVFDERFEAFAQAGGRVVHLETSARNVLVLTRPFWREGIRVVDRTVPWMAALTTGDLAGLQFLSVATDLCFDRNKLLARFGSYRSVVRRIDARKYGVTEYLFEAPLGRGTYIGTTLQLAGGRGIQPTSMDDNAFGRVLLRALVNEAAAN